MKKFCSNCQEWHDSWADHPNYRSYSTYRRYERCWKCDEWTLSDRTIYLPRSSNLSRERVREGLDNVRGGRMSRFTCGNERYVSGERTRETLIYDGGGIYTRITERGGHERIENNQLRTFEEVFFLEIMDAVMEVNRVICPVS